MGPVRVSEQEGVDCTYSRDGCQGGWPDDYWQMTINRGGAQFNSVYPYTASWSGSCLNQDGKTDDNPRAASYGRISYSIENVYNKLALGPVSVALAAGNNVFRYYKDGVLSLADNCPTRLDHAVALVAYTPSGEYTYPAQDPTCFTMRKKEQKRGCPTGYTDNGNNECCDAGTPEETRVIGSYWTIQNSWGVGWGDGGFMNMAVTDGGYGVCGMNNYMDYLEI